MENPTDAPSPSADHLPTPQHRDLTVPAAALSALRRSVAAQVGPVAAVRALQAAGWAAGESLGRTFERTVADRIGQLDQERFWRRFGEFLAQRGWGRLEHARPHPGVALLRSADWAEAVGPGAEPQPTCAFSSGMLAGLLTQLAGGPVAVLEIDCRASGDDHCGFAFGSEPTVRRLYDLLREDLSFEAALDRL